MSDFGGSNNGGSAAPSRAPSPTPSQRERDQAKAEATAQAKAEAFAKAKEAGWCEVTAVDYDRQLNNGEWYGNSAKYEWDDEYGDVAPDVPELEKILFGDEYHVRSGDHMHNLTMYKVAVEGPEQLAPIQNFDDAGLHPVIRNNIRLCGYQTPTPIQAYTIPAVLLGHDVVAVALTGSGKTAAYLIPVLSKLMGKAKKLRGPRPKVNTNSDSYDTRKHGVRAEPLVVIVVPTRELAVQIFDETRRMCYKSMLRPCVAYGGYPMGEQVNDLSKGCDILIATPGRLCALMDKPDLLTMGRVKYTIIDEADEMLTQDWSDEVTKVLQGGDSNEDADHIFLLFSATFPKDARALARELMAEDYYRIRLGRGGQAHKNIEQDIIEAAPDNKLEALYDYLFSFEEPARTLIFCNSKPAVDTVDDYLYNKGLPSTSIHSGRDQTHREDSIRAFRTGKCPIMVATGVACRGWDVKDVKFIINYDLPKKDYGGISEYVHRIGRTGRIGHKGKAMSFYTERDEELAQDLVNILVESGSEVPEFLAHLKPEDGEKIEGLGGGDTDDEDEAEAEGDDAFAAEEGEEGGAPIADAW